ncbi:hypothetical protein [Bradyrhizobium sp. BR 10261]|uniref:hypothetical protein n=1 Tax=Bradyrhizobium sp. BR 10261 TaxID=2749992 RepID=UPI001C64DFE4|nr:hypothetical protein [Bradyrhizobium sp. BR 10261]MBW7964966.1 hypothetical protein [Bradyrhizobium sp. BR 10261]
MTVLEMILELGQLHRQMHWAVGFYGEETRSSPAYRASVAKATELRLRLRAARMSGPEEHHPDFDVAAVIDAMMSDGDEAVASAA